jgi:hypothetical protein
VSPTPRVLSAIAAKKPAFVGQHARSATHNAMSESFFATLECELIDRRRFWI